MMASDDVAQARRHAGVHHGGDVLLTGQCIQCRRVLREERNVHHVATGFDHRAQRGEAQCTGHRADHQVEGQHRLGQCAVVGDVQNERGDGMLMREFLKRFWASVGTGHGMPAAQIDGDRLSDQAGTQDQYLLLANLVLRDFRACLLFVGQFRLHVAPGEHGAAEGAHEDGIGVDVGLLIPPP